MAGHRGPPVSVSASAGFSFHRGDSCKCACPRAGAPSSWSLTGFTQLQGTRPALDHTEPRSWLGWRDASPGSPAPVGAFLDGCRRLLTLGWFPEGVSTPLARDSGLSAAPELSLVPGTRSLSRGHGGRQPRLLSVPWCPAQPLESLTAEPPFSLMLQVPLPQRRAPAAVGVCAVVLAARGPATAGGSHTVTTREQSGQRTARWTSRCTVPGGAGARRPRSLPHVQPRPALPLVRGPLSQRVTGKGQGSSRRGAKQTARTQGSRSVSRLGLSCAARGRLHGPAAFTHRQLRPLLTSSHSHATGLVSWRWVEAHQRPSQSPGATGASPPAAASPSLLPSLLPSIAHLIPPGRFPSSPAASPPAPAAACAPSFPAALSRPHSAPSRFTVPPCAWFPVPCSSHPRDRTPDLSSLTCTRK